MESVTMNNEPICISDFEMLAKERLPKAVFDYYASAANDKQTLFKSTAAFKRLRLLPRILRNVSSVDMSTSILGEKIDVPFCIAPTAMHKLAHPDGEIGTAKASSRIGTCMTLSSWSFTSLEDVAANTEGLKWFHTDILVDRNAMASVIRRAEASGYKAIVLTADMPICGKRHNDIRCQFTVPPLPNFKKVFESRNMTKVGPSNIDEVHDPSATWDTVIPWLKSITSLSVVMKGILTGEDAKLAVKYGVDGIIVSNHGGRQLNGVPATIEVLPSIVSAVGHDIEVYLDGGIRFGSDIFKALALGARAVFIGRPILWGLAHQGEEGVYRVLQIFKEELKITMALCGCASLGDIVKEMVVRESCIVPI
ncbi:hydroxyacid oxidase 1-like [Dendronephthya gigantea]|uniref:hydroxyacid oxidase 1-like n=1 Tax=Dendronephthya gigantea TaxID=151771 RepID=UPI00106B78A8|nr:hydroxyacid oxidase 1-like [Dendronephthya gigantea]